MKSFFFLSIPLVSLIANPNGIEFLTQTPSDLLPLPQQGSASNLDEIVQLLFEFQDDIEGQFGFTPNMLEAIEQSIQSVDNSLEFSEGEKIQLIAAYNLLKENLTPKTEFTSHAWGFGKKRSSRARI